MALAPGQTLQSAYGYQGTFNPQFQWQGNPYPPQLSPQGIPVRTSGRPTQPSQMVTGPQWGKRKNRKGTKKGGKSRKNRRSNTMRKGRRTNRK